MTEIVQQEGRLISNADLRSGVPLTVIDSSVSTQVRAMFPRGTCPPRMQHQTDIPQLCQQILHIVSAPVDLVDMLAQMAAAIGEAFQVDGCAITLSETVLFTAPTVYWLPNTQPLHLSHLQLPSPAFVDDLTETIIATDVADSSGNQEIAEQRLVEIWQAVPWELPNLQLRSLIGMPTKFQGKLNGLISLMRSTPGEWSQSEIDSLQLVAQQVAMAIAQSQLQQQVNQQIQYQTVVNQLTMAVRNSSDLTDILELATRETAKALHVDRGLLLRLKYWDPLFRNRTQEQLPKIRVNVACEWVDSAASERNHWQPISDAGCPASPDTNLSFWMSECTLCQRAFIHSSTPILAVNEQQFQHQDAEPTIASVFNLAHLASLLLIPLESQGTVLGFLVFQHSQARTWRPEEVELVKLVSAQVSTAIIQTETLRQVQALVEKRTAELRESLLVQSKLYERTRQQLEQLRHLNQLKDEFLSTVSHELRTPLTSMTMAIRMLRQTGLSSDRSARYLDILEQQCAQETNLITDLLGLQELEAKQVLIQLQEINLKDTIKELAASFKQKWAAKGLSLSVSLPKRSLKLQSDRDSLHRVLLELLTNAGKYSEPNTCVNLAVTQVAQPTGNQIVMTLRNTGPGISPAELPYIFEKFRRCQGATQNAVQGTGLGLALVESLVQHLNGTITASSCPTDQTQSCETCFTLTLPQLFDKSKL